MSRKGLRSGLDSDSEDDDFTEETATVKSEDEPSEEYEEDIHRQQRLKDEEEKKQSEINESTNNHNNENGFNEDDEDDDDALRSHRKRSRKAVNYNEDSIFPKLEDDESEEFEQNQENNNNDDDEESKNTSSSKRRRTRNSLEDDEDFNFENDIPPPEDDEFIADDDEDYDSETRLRNRRKREPGFVVKDADDINDDTEFDISSENTRRRRSFNRRRGNGRSYDNQISSGRSTRNSRRHVNDINLGDDSTAGIEGEKNIEDGPLTLEDELNDLQNDSPLNSPKRNLRGRKNVNYTLPPALLTDAQLEEQINNGSDFASPRRGRNGRFGGANVNTTQIRRLFPTVGPFGGSEIHALFQNGGIPDGLTALGNAESSDSDDDNDLFKPTDPNDTNKTIINLNSTPLNQQQKKKNTLADTDPLGIDTNIDFSVVGGLDNYINQLKEMITLPLLYPEIYSKFHITPPRGVLFHGPPGTGKTLMARALASSCSSQDKKITFFMRKGADCLSKWVGEAERHLRLLFEEAKQQQPSIIFFDEIDGLAPVRSSKQEQIHASIVSTLLALMDGMDNRGQVIVIGATNRPDSIDPALRRPGRFDREFYFPLPDLKAREEILKIHMKKWDNKLDNNFIEELSRLTKGYGGADLRALCTESALNSIQRVYPQIYKSNDKLKIDISKIKVESNDFIRSLKKIIPSSSRSTSIISEPLPNHLIPLLEIQFKSILNKIKDILPLEKDISLLEESEYVNLNNFLPNNNAFQIQQMVSSLNNLRIFKPRLSILSKKGQGCKYLCSAILNNLEGFTFQILDLNKLFNDSSIGIENLCIQLFSELKRHKPSVLFIPDTIEFLRTIGESVKLTIKYLINSIGNNEPILVLCGIEVNEDEYEFKDETESENYENNSYIKEQLNEIEDIFNFKNENVIKLRNATDFERENFFKDIFESILMNPYDFNDLSMRPKRKLKKLKVLIEDTPKEKIIETKNANKIKREIARNDMRLKNSLKVKLSLLMDLFKVRYKRFKRPIIDDSYLIHLFDESPDVNSPYQIKNDMILEKSTGKLYYNIDLDVIEERLWNGFYSEPKQFLNDLELILKDAKSSGDRDRLLKANEMYAHAQVGVEEIEIQFPILAKQWKEVRHREKKREVEYFRELKSKSTQKELELDEGLNTENAIEKIEPNDLIEQEEVDNNLNNINSDEVDANEAESNCEQKLITDKSDEKVEIQTQTQAQEQIQPNQMDTELKLGNEEIEVTPVEIKEPAEKVELEKLVEEKKDENDESQVKELEDKNVSLHAHLHCNGNKNESNGKSRSFNEDHKVEDVEETSSEEEITPPEIKTVKVDVAEITKLKLNLIDKTRGLPIERLEMINTEMIKLVWQNRLELDKTALLLSLRKLIDAL